jgi:hypothetical protein
MQAEGRSTVDQRAREKMPKNQFKSTTKILFAYVNTSAERVNNSWAMAHHPPGHMYPATSNAPNNYYYSFELY